MSDSNRDERAKEIFETICTAIESRGWHFSKEEELMLVNFGIRGEDIPMRFVVVVDARRQLVVLMSHLPFKMKEDKRIEGAIVTCAATNKLANGCFGYDITTGAIVFRMAASYRESTIGEAMFLYMIDAATAAVDQFNDLFFGINEDLISVEDFLNGI